MFKAIDDDPVFMIPFGGFAFYISYFQIHALAVQPAGADRKQG
jgi:hypothetical protein